VFAAASAFTANAVTNWRACRVHVQELLNGGAASVARAVGLGRSAAEKVNDRIRLALELWDEGRDPRGTLAEKYLRSRGLGLIGPRTHARR
jgi:hypothetical protein